MARSGALYTDISISRRVAARDFARGPVRSRCPTPSVRTRRPMLTGTCSQGRKTRSNLRRPRRSPSGVVRHHVVLDADWPLARWRSRVKLLDRGNARHAAVSPLAAERRNDSDSSTRGWRWPAQSRRSRWCSSSRRTGARAAMRAKRDGCRVERLDLIASLGSNEPV